MSEVLGEAIVEIRADTSRLSSDVSDSGKKAGKGFTSGFTSALKGLAVGFVAFKAVDALTSSFKEAASSIQFQDQLLAQTQAVLKSTGGAAGVTAKQILGLSNALEAKSLIDQEQIQNGENVLLTFTNIRNEVGKGNDIFTQATKTAVDLSTALGQSMQSSAIQLGKALNDPVKGITALSRVGVSFTEQQKAQVAQLVKTGDTLGAQKLILGELTKEFGGSAKAAGDTFGGQVKHLHDIWDGFIESIVRRAIPMLSVVVGFLAGKLPGAIQSANGFISKLAAEFRSLLPTLEQIGGQIISQVVVPAFETLQAVIPQVVTAIGNLLPVIAPVAAVVAGALVVGFRGVLVVVQQLAPVIVSLTGFLAAHKTLVQTLAVVILTLVAAWKAWQIAVTVVSAVTKAYTAVQLALNAVMSANPIGLVVIAIAALAAGLIYAYTHSEKFRNIVNGAFNAVKNVVGNVTGFITNAVSGAIDFVRAHWKLMVAILAGPIGLAVFAIAKNWGKIKAAFTTGVNTVKSVVSNGLHAVLGVFQTVGSAIAGAVSNMFGRVSSLVKTGVGRVVSDIAALPGKVIALVGKMKSAGEKFIGGLFDGITSAASAGAGFVVDLASSLKSAINSVLGLPLVFPGWDWPGPGGIGAKTLIPAFAAGVANFTGGMALVGENGPELVTLPRGANVFPSDQTGQLLGTGSPTFNIHLPTGDPEAAAMAVWSRWVASTPMGG